MELGTAFKNLLDSFGSEVLCDNTRLKSCFKDLFVKDSVHYFLCIQMVSLNIFIKFYNADKDRNKSFKQQTASECVEILCDQLLLSRDASVNAINALCSALDWRGVSVPSVCPVPDIQVPQPSPDIKSPSCGTASSFGSSFCRICGISLKPVKLLCSSCDIELPAYSSFSPSCGTPVGKIPVPSPQPSSSTSLSVGDTVEFGRYPQDSDGTERPIKWDVLAIENGRALLFSKYGLDCVRYHNEWVDITWEYCDLRRWLNDDFYNRAFNRSEQSKIAEVLLKNANNQEYGTYGGNATYDKIFCLSIDEAEKYFPADVERGGLRVNDYRCRKATAYAVNRGAYAYEYDSDDSWAISAYDGNCWYWLRSPGHDTFSAAFVYYFACVGLYGDSVSHDNYVLAPALWVYPA